MKIPKHPALLISGPSGVGKNTIVDLLLKQYPKLFEKAISHTTRAPRGKEVHGKHYHFTKPDDFRAMITEQKFIEHATVHGHLYGNSIDAIHHVRNVLKKICVLEADITGYQLIRNSQLIDFPIHAIAIVPPDLAELETRLRGRKTESEAKIKERLQNARRELSFCLDPKNKFDSIIINHDSWTVGYPELEKIAGKLFPEIILHKMDRNSSF